MLQENRGRCFLGARQDHHRWSALLGNQQDKGSAAAAPPEELAGMVPLPFAGYADCGQSALYIARLATGCPPVRPSHGCLDHQDVHQGLCQGLCRLFAALI